MKFALQIIATQLLWGLIHTHGYLSRPAALYTDLTTRTAAVAIVNANQLFPDRTWNGSPHRNSQQYQDLVASKAIGD